MNVLNDDSLAILALTSRLIDAPVKPLSARELSVLRGVTSPASLLGKTAAEIASSFGLPVPEADRVAALLGRGTGLAIALEKISHAGIWTLTDCDDRYPARLRQQLGEAAPVVLHGVGDVTILGSNGIGIVGSRNASADGISAASDIALTAVRAGMTVVSGGARGIDQSAMNSAFTSGGSVIGVLADSLENAVERRATRKGITSGTICLVTPYAPATVFSVGNAMGRNKIIYGLSRITVVVATDTSGGTWNGATEALKHGYGRVASWRGSGTGPGNEALLPLGAISLRGADQLTKLLAKPDPDNTPEPEFHEKDQQLSLEFWSECGGG